MIRYSSYSATNFRQPVAQSALELQYHELLELRERVRRAEIAAAHRPQIEVFMSGAKGKRRDFDPSCLGS